jgi:signal transduction histidine kinase
LAARHEEIEQLHAEIAELRASRERLVLAGDAERRGIERELHRGLQQHLVALAVRLQLAEAALGSDAVAATALFAEMSRDIQDAIDEAARLAQRIYAPVLELGLGAALRAAAVSVGVPASVAVSAGSSYAPEVLTTVYRCWLEALECTRHVPPAISVRDDDGALTFEVLGDARPQADLDALRDRIEALGGTVTVRPEARSGVRITASLPLLR